MKCFPRLVPVAIGDPAGQYHRPGPIPWRKHSHTAPSHPRGAGLRPHLLSASWRLQEPLASLLPTPHPLLLSLLTELGAAFLLFRPIVFRN